MLTVMSVCPIISVLCTSLFGRPARAMTRRATMLLSRRRRDGRTTVGGSSAIASFAYRFGDTSASTLASSTLSPATSGKLSPSPSGGADKLAPPPA